MSKTPNFWVVIPARRASTRLPDKPLADIHGKPMVVRVAERAKASQASRVIVATDDAEIFNAVSDHGHEALMTKVEHASGTDRISEVAVKLCASNEQIMVNVQGDEPLIEPDLITRVAADLANHQRAAVSTAAAPIDDAASITNPNVVKVVCNAQDEALYFSRSPIPFHRDQWASLALAGLAEPPLFKHIGIYAFRAAALADFVRHPACPLETIERLEQLRWLWLGYSISVSMLQRTPGHGVDTESDLEQVRRLWPTMGSL